MVSFCADKLENVCVWRFKYFAKTYHHHCSSDKWCSVDAGIAAAGGFDKEAEDDSAIGTTAGSRLSNDPGGPLMILRCCDDDAAPFDVVTRHPHRP